MPLPGGQSHNLLCIRCVYLSVGIRVGKKAAPVFVARDSRMYSALERRDWLARDCKEQVGKKSCKDWLAPTKVKARWGVYWPIPKCHGLFLRALLQIH